MKQTIAAIRDAVAKECWLPALALALTVPDVLGQIAYPELVNNRGKRLVGQQYRRWFHENVEHRFADHTGYDDNTGTRSAPIPRLICATSCAVSYCMLATMT